MKFAARKRREAREENLIPLINIVFLLLIFFMLVGRLLPPEALIVDPPLSSSEQPAESEELVLVMAADGRLALGERIFAPDQLEPELAPKLSTDPLPVITLKADADAPAADLISVLEALQGLGVEQLTLLSAAGG